MNVENNKYTGSSLEANYIRALSRESTVQAYAKWNELSKTEQLCFDASIKSNYSILDLGCGTGRIAKLFGDKINYYLGVDKSSEMIATAKMLNPSFDFLCEDILMPTYQKSDFDAVLLLNNVIDMLHPVERRKDTFDLAKKSLSYNGVIILSSHLTKRGIPLGYYEEDYHGATVNTYRSSFSEFCDEVERNGFNIKLAARDYRNGFADWTYIVASL